MWNVNSKKAILVSGFGQAKIIAGRDFDHALKRAVIDFHDEKFAFRAAPAFGTLSADHQAISLHRQFQVFSTHPGKFDLDDESAIGDIDVGIGNPMRFTACFGSANGGLFRRVIKRGVNFAHDESVRETIA